MRRVRRTGVVFDEIPAVPVAEELGLKVAALYLAKSRVLKMLCQEAKGSINYFLIFLIDFFA